MPELAVADVERYTGGRIDKDDPETLSLLARGLATARRFCGWHVTPVQTDTDRILDGPGGTLLRLPTLRLSELSTISEDGNALTVTDLYISQIGMVRKKSGAAWSCNFGALKVTMEHGYDTAPDFHAAVLSWIDRMSLTPAGGRAHKIGPFEYPQETANGSVFTDVERSLLEMYRLERPA